MLKLIDAAIDHFSTNAEAFFIDGLQRYVEESIVKVLLARSNEGYYNFNTTDLKAFDKIIKLHIQDLRKRIGLKKASGKETSWTPERRKEALDFYETRIKTIKEAKTYIELLRGVDEMENGKSNSRSEKNKAAKKEIFKKKMETTFADLPEEVIENIITNTDDESGFLARKCVGEKFNLEGLEYIATILTQARNERKSR